MCERFADLTKFVKFFKGLKVAPYCDSLSWASLVFIGFDDPEHSTSMDNVIEAVGAGAVFYSDEPTLTSTWAYGALHNTSHRISLWTATKRTGMHRNIVQPDRIFENYVSDQAAAKPA